MTPSAYRTARSGNFYDKYNSRNLLVRLMVRSFLTAFNDLARSRGAYAVELGCGEGYLSFELAKAGYRVSAFNVSQEVIRKAIGLAKEKEVHNAEFGVADIYGLPPIAKPIDLLVCCEVLEHLDHPDTALEIIDSLEPRFTLLSVPREPIWRMLNLMRGKYLPDWGNTPGHVQHWSPEAFLKFAADRFKILKVRHPFPWTTVLCSRKI